MVRTTTTPVSQSFRLLHQKDQKSQKDQVICPRPVLTCSASSVQGPGC